MSPPTDDNVQLELSRDLGLVSALAIGAGTMIAAGIFTLSGLAVGYVGSAAIVSFMLAALVAGFTALSYCEFTSIYPESGEGYLYARKTFSPPIAYIVGWCLLLGYVSSCAFYIASLSTYFNEFIWRVPVEQLSGLLILAGLTLLNIKGTRESGHFQIAVTAVKIGLLVWFVWGGLDAVDADALWARFSNDVPQIASTAALVFITFFGFSAIAASAGDIKNPTRTVPIAIFASMGIVTVLYSFVVLVIVSAGLTEYTEAAMGTAAQAFLGPIGGMVIVGGAIFSMISASNASVLAGSRVALSMSHLRHLPIELGTVNVQTGTPVVALMLVGISIGSFTLVLPLESLAHFADCVLLIALTLVNVALIQHRRVFPDIERPFRVPLVPALPAVAILANLYLLIQIPVQGHIVPTVLAFMAMSAGFVGFLVWKGAKFETEAPLEPPSVVLAERSAAAPARFKILLPIANPANAQRLVDLAAAVASAAEGEIIGLRVVLLPEQLPPTLEEEYVVREESLLALVRKSAVKHHIPVSSQIRIGRNVGKAILESARQKRCDLIILGWKGFTSTTRRMLGDVTDHVVNHARSDIMFVKLEEDEKPVRKILLPTAGGIHARRAEQYAASIAQWRRASLTLCAVVSSDAGEPAESEARVRLMEAKSRINCAQPVDIRVVRHASVATGIIETAEEYDMVIVGAAGVSFTTQVLFGGIPETIARHSKTTVIVVKHHEPVKALFGRVMTE